MTNQNFFELAGYFANPTRNTRIEIEAKQSVINAYKDTYKQLTNTSLPIGSDSVVVLPNSADKWGREMRLYFSCSNLKNVPQSVNNHITVGGRPGYDDWNKRLNSGDIIDRLFEFGFRLGHPQDHEFIKDQIPEEYMKDFQGGYDAL
ncbi:MAG: hypothetical protein J0M29_21765 [Chitinophagales bacterium]|nr:hypothetical protein [Chitinophagales bacterium]